jgi:Ni,Fe-hydrogenase maturation factor
VERKEVNPQQLPGPSNHQVDPACLLRSSQEVYGRCPMASLITVPGKSFAFGQQLTRSVEQAIPAAVKMVEECIERQVTAER